MKMTGSVRRVRAAQYLRSSTGKQDSSIAIQADMIARYADDNDLKIVRTFADEGRSGVTLAGRPGLQGLLRTVMAGNHDFEALLILDVSRWGRFQNPDESAHYEWLIRNAGIAVHYCGESFGDDTSLGGAILKAVKRSLAGEYARELSAKVLAGQLRAASLGFWPSGQAPYGTRRMVVDAQGMPRAVLEAGERKSVQSDKVILVPGPAAEIRVVRLVFRLAARGMTQVVIADHLNAKRVRSRTGKPWTRYMIAGMLNNQCYVGRLVYNRTSKPLGAAERANQRDAWIVREGLMVPLVGAECFDKAALMRSRRYHKWTRAEVIDCLADLLSRKGYLTAALIDATPGVPTSYTCRRLFGSLWALYLELGYVPLSAANGARRGRVSEKVRDSMIRVTGSRSDGDGGRAVVDEALLKEELARLRARA